MEASSATRGSSKTAPPPPPPPYPPPAYLHPSRVPHAELTNNVLPAPGRTPTQDGKAQDGNQLEIDDLQHNRDAREPLSISTSLDQGLTEPLLPVDKNALTEAEGHKVETPHSSRLDGLVREISGLSTTVSNHAERLGGEHAIGFESKEFTPDEKLKLCRRASKIHFESILFPTAMVREWINPGLEDFYEKHTSTIHQRLWVIFAAALMVFMPYTYGNTVMRDSCLVEEHTVHWRGRSVGDTREAAGLQKKDCNLERLMRSTEGIKWGAYLVGIATSLMLCLSMITTIMIWFAKRADTAKDLRTRNQWLNWKRILWRPLLLLWYYWLNVKMPNVKYANESNIFPSLYTRPSVLICFIYVGLLVEMVLIGYISNRFATGVVVAYGMGEVFLMAGNHVLGGSASVVAVTNAAIREWIPKQLVQKNNWMHLELLSCHHTVMDKLFAHSTKAISLTNFDLMMLEEITGGGENKPRSVTARPFRGEDTPDSIGVIDFVWLYNATGAPEEIKLMENLPMPRWSLVFPEDKGAPP